MFQSSIYKLLTNTEVWKFLISLGFLYFILFYLRVFYMISSIIQGICATIKDITLKVYVHLMLMAYQHKSGTDMSEYRKNAVCEFRGIKCTHITMADVLIIEHPLILKPVIIVCYFVNTIIVKFRQKRIKRI